MTHVKLERIFDKHAIPATDRPGFRSLVDLGIRPGTALLNKLQRGRYAKALNDVMTELSKGLRHKFPPAMIH